MLKGCGECINDVDIYKGAYHARENKGNRMHTLYLQQDEITGTDNHTLDETGDDEQKPSAEISLCWSKASAQSVGVYFLLENRHQNQAADPKREVCVKRCHAGTVIFHIILYIRLDGDRRGHEIGNSIGVNAFQREQLLIRIRALQRFQIGGDCPQLLIDRIEGFACLTEHIGAVVHRGFQLCQYLLDLLGCRWNAGQCGRQIAVYGGETIQRLVDLRENLCV